MGRYMHQRRAWRKSTKSSRNGSCVEVEHDHDQDLVWVRNNNNSCGTVLKFTPAEWRTFITGVKTGKFDLPARPRQEPTSPLAGFLLEVLRESTADDESQRRVLKLFRFIRATGLAFAGVIIGGAVIVGAAVAGGAAILGAHHQLAICCGVGGSATFFLTACFRAGRCTVLLLRALSHTGQRGDSPSGPAPQTDNDQRAA